MTARSATSCVVSQRGFEVSLSKTPQPLQLTQERNQPGNSQGGHYLKPHIRPINSQIELSRMLLTSILPGQNLEWNYRGCETDISLFKEKRVIPSSILTTENKANCFLLERMLASPSRGCPLCVRGGGAGFNPRAKEKPRQWWKKATRGRNEDICH